MHPPGLARVTVPSGRVRRMVHRAFYVDPDDWEAAQRVAYSRGESMSDVLRRAVAGYPDQARWR